MAIPPAFDSREPVNGQAVAVVTSNGRAAPRLAPRSFRRSSRTQSLMGIGIVGSGSYVPEKIVTNKELEYTYGYEPGWIEQRTGILARRHAAPDEATSDLSVEAARRAMVDAGVRNDDVDLVVVGTFTPDHACPSTACLVQDRLNLDAPAFDVQAACSGFMYALVTAGQYVATGNSQCALVIGADVNSRIVDPTDQRTAPLFGDGAGAVIVTRGDDQQGLIRYQNGADGAGGPLLECPVGGTRRPVCSESIDSGEHFLRMDGRNVFKWAIRIVADSIELVLNEADVDPEDVQLYILHQANIRILNAAAQSLGVPEEKLFSNLQQYGNTSGGSIPLALDEAYRAGRIQRGDQIVLCGFGAGLTWGTGLMRW